MPKPPHSFCLSVRQVERLKKRMREDGEAALAHAHRGRPSHRRLPDAVREPMVRLARSTYAGFNDHHLCEKLVEREGFSLSRETLRRLLRRQGLGSPRKCRPPVHRQRRVRSAQPGELVQLDSNPHDWLEARGPRLSALGMQDDVTGKILAAQFFPSETAFGYLCLLRPLLRRHRVPLAFYGDHSGILVRNDDSGTVPEQLAGKRHPTPFGRALEALAITFIRKPKAASRVSGVGSRIASPANCGSPKPPTSTPPTPCSASSSPTTTVASPASLAKTKLPGARLRKILSASVASCSSAWSATTTSCSGRAAASRSPSRLVASASPRCQSADPPSSRWPRLALLWRHPPATLNRLRGDTFMLPLG